MSARSPIQVPEELKNRVEELKGKFYAKTNYEVIERLCQYYEQSENQKVIERQKREREEEERRETMVYLGSDTKEKFVEFTKDMGFRSESDSINFLLAHYQNSGNMDMKTFDLYRSLRN